MSTDSGRERLSTVDALAQLSFAVNGVLERRAARHDLSMIQTRLLGVLRDRRPTMNQLAGYLELDKSSVSGLVDRAARRGLVERVASATDGRAVHVALTRRGRALAARVSAEFENDVESLLEPLAAAQRLTLADLAARVVAVDVERRGLDLSAGPLH
ncbi:MarR family winged helix-turn-helix transcriptional regulator [uncultured Jatrophihabitans sp.]|uniref:MarR family winged helix-turn-helix transcriptional regulator n=1 Tax=uncultured Jatrophihabitans sp. TaxID=1610747 RepID=UPI0035CAD4A5